MKKEKNKMDMKKVNKIKEAIKNGTFFINPETIADKLMYDIGVEYLLKTKEKMH